MGNSPPKLSLDEQMKLHKRQISKAIRELEREKNQLATQEKKTINEMKKLAKQGQTGTVKIMAKDLVRCRKYQSKFLTMKAQLQGVSLQLQTMKSTASMTNAMQGVTRVMLQMNSSMDASAVTKIMQEFMSENERQQMTEEVLTDAIDDAMGDDEGEEETVVNQVLEEIGIEISTDLGKVGSERIGIPSQASQVAPGAVQRPPHQPAIVAQQEDDDLEARLNALKR
ncbi:unnamed protein product [Amoebophrya sp. A120]|nr:unnamed protein product [Amoebophrya sp. A120]|eukprot:GSA120T00015218001.1